MGILVWIYLYITSHLVLGVYLTLILKICISDRHTDDNFERKNLCLSRDSNPDLTTGGLTNSPTETRQGTNLSLIQSFQSMTSQECNMLQFAREQPTSGYFWFGFTYIC